MCFTCPTCREEPRGKHDCEHDERGGGAHDAQRGQRQPTVQVAVLQRDRHHEAWQKKVEWRYISDLSQRVYAIELLSRLTT